MKMFSIKGKKFNNISVANNYIAFFGHAFLRIFSKVILEFSQIPNNSVKPLSSFSKEAFSISFYFVKDKIFISGLSFFTKLKNLEISSSGIVNKTCPIYYSITSTLQKYKFLMNSRQYV